MKNIVLIGMPGSGKSCVGRALSRILHRPFVDTDNMVEQAAQKSISAIFAEDGEAHFRKLETCCVCALAAAQGQIIASGGGVILRPENMDVLTKNGIIVFLDRPIEAIVRVSSLDDRPLLHSGRGMHDGPDPNQPDNTEQTDKNDQEARLWQLYHQRIELYRSYAAYHIRNTGRVRSTAHMIAKKICAHA